MVEKTDKKEKELIFYLIREGWIRSIIADSYMFGGMFGLLYLNHNFLGDKFLIDLVSIILIFLGSVSKSRTKRFNNEKDLLAELKNK